MHSPLRTTAQPLLERATHFHLSDRSQTWFSRHQWQLYALALIAADLLAIGLAFRLAYWLRFSVSVPIFQTEIVPSLTFYRGVSFLLIGLYLGIFAATGLYSRRNLLGGTLEYSLVFRATTIGILIVVVAGFVAPDFILARGWLVIAWLASFLFVATERFLLRRVVYRMRTRGFYLSRALVVGANAEGRSLVSQLLSWRTSGLYVVGMVDEELPTGKHVTHGLNCLGSLRDLRELVDRFGISEIVIATSAVHRTDLIDIFQDFGLRDDLTLRLSSGLYEIITTGVEVNELAFVPLVRINRVRLTGADRMMKLALDYTLGFIALVGLLPVIIALAILVRLDSSGPVIYKRRVMGVNGTEFDAYKFRTMYVNGDEILAQYPDLERELATTHKLKDDPRVTKVGRFLRQTSLDELPQLFNVLRGQMSLVGPRMISPAEMRMYSRWSTNLLTVNPGITGLWQISGRSDISYEERVRLDMHYVRNWTIWMDVKILLQTIPAVLKRDGAY